MLSLQQETQICSSFIDWEVEINFLDGSKFEAAALITFLALILNVCVYQRDSMLLKGVQTICWDTLLWLASQLNGTK